MPECQNCGNTETFRTKVVGHEVHAFEAGGGPFVEVVDRDTRPISGWCCDECGSSRVESG